MIEALTRLLTALIVFHVARVSVIFSGSPRLMPHSVGTRWQNSLQAGVGLAKAVACSSGARGSAAIFPEAFSPANAALVSTTKAVAQRPNAATRHITQPICAGRTPCITPPTCSVTNRYPKLSWELRRLNRIVNVWL